MLLYITTFKNFNQATENYDVDNLKNVMEKDFNVCGWIRNRNNGRLEVVL